jgi:hypothetical protein
MIDLSDTFVTIVAYPEPHIHIRLVRWLLQIGITQDRWNVVTQRDTCCAYNTGIMAALHSRFNSFIFADNDISPQVGPTDGLLSSPLDVCGVMYTVTDHAFDNPASFHAGLWRTSRRVLEAIAPPWFGIRYSADGTSVDRCMCDLMRDKALSAGFTVGHAGWAAHKIKR